MALTLALGLLLAAEPRCEVRRTGAAPPPPGVFARLGKPVLDGAMVCPVGTVPVPAPLPPVPELPPRPAPAADEHDCTPEGCWAWAGWNDRRPMRGAGARLSIETPAVAAPDHALTEIALQWGRAEQDIVELGWEVAPRRHGDPQPRLFVHRWVQGKACASPCGFEISSRRLWLDMPLGRWIGKELAVGWLLWEGRAWAWVDGEWLGSFPLGPDAPRIAPVAQWFGEVFFVRTPPRVPMGNGLAADSSGAARMTSVCDVPEQGVHCVVRPERFPRVSQPDAYSMRTEADGGFRYGGPLRPRPPPSSASEGTPPATGR